MPPSRYRMSLRAVVGASAAPYGYTLTIWTTGAVLTHNHGIPSAPDALIFMAGAVLGFIAVGVIVFGDIELRFVPEERHIGGWGSFHVPSVGMAIGLAWLVAQIHGAVACADCRIRRYLDLRARARNADDTGRNETKITTTRAFTRNTPRSQSQAA